MSLPIQAGPSGCWKLRLVSVSLLAKAHLFEAAVEPITEEWPLLRTCPFLQVLPAVALLVLASCTQDPPGEIRKMLQDERWVKPRISLDQTALSCLPAQGRSLSMSCGDGRPSARALRRLVAIAKKDPPSTRIAVSALLGFGPRTGLQPSEEAFSDEWSDFAALELLRAYRAGDRRRSWSALQATRRALELDASNRRALFNQALAQEQLFLDEAARESWRLYLEVEPDDAWRWEAEAHLERLDRPTVHDDWQAVVSELMSAQSSGRLPELSPRFVSEVRELFLGQYLERWAAEPFDATLCTDSGRWQAIGEVHESVTGDVLITESVQWLTAEFCSPRRSRGTRRALAWIAEALELYDRSDSAASLSLLQKARPPLESGDSPLLALVDLYSAVNVFALNRYGEAEARFQELEPRFLSRGFLFLAARAAWLQGTIALRKQDLASAVEHYRRAQALFDRLSDLSHGAAIRGLIAETLARMGLFQDAWRSGLEGIGQARHLGHAHRLYTSCSLLGIVAALEGAYDLATEYQECAAKYVRTLANHAAETDVLLWQAAWLHRAGKPERARKSLDEARRSAEEIADEDEQRQARADLALIEGVLDWKAAPRTALKRLAVAIEFFDEIGHHYYASDARLLQASAAEGIGNLEMAEESLLGALQLHETFRVGDSNPESRLTMLHNDHSIYDRLVRFQLDQREDPWRALFFADRGKQDRYSPIRPAASRLDHEISATVARWQQALERLPQWVTVVSYQLLADELVAWVLRPGQALELSRAPRPAPALVARQAPSRDPSWADLLSAPLRDRVTANGLLVVVADKQLNDFPVARLTPSPDGALVVQTAAVVAATSVDDFLTGQPERQHSQALGSVQAFLAPLPSRAISELPPLEPSSFEVAALAENFRDVEIWKGAEATAGRFLGSVRRPGVLHFSGHVLVDERQPLESALLFSADSTREDGRVTARELYTLGHSAASLVSLAGCGSSAAPRSLPLSFTLVRPFLSAGVPAALGSLRPLPDDLFVRFMTAFYRELGRTQSVLLAFRNAQRRLISSSPREDLRWAEIQLYATQDILEMRRN